MNTREAWDASIIVFNEVMVIEFRVAKISGKITQHERAICARLKYFREGIKWSQPEFADQIALTRDQLASIEYARTPLRYDVAWRIRRAFGLSVMWLESGHLDPDALYEDASLPLSDASGIAQYALLSEVVAASGRGYKNPTPKPKTVELSADDLSDRGRWLFSMKVRLRDWMARLPKGRALDFHNVVLNFAQDFIRQFPEEPKDIVQARFDALIWEEMRRDLRRKSRGAEQPHGGLVKGELDSVHASVNIGGVKAQWPLLKKRLQKATEPTGLKSKLAGFLDVKIASVSQWLSDSKSQREPGAETALRMLKWVELQERSAK